MEPIIVNPIPAPINGGNPCALKLIAVIPPTIERAIPPITLKPKKIVRTNRILCVDSIRFIRLIDSRYSS